MPNDPTCYCDIGQNTPEWHQLRCGMITASELSDFVTPKFALATSQTSETALYRVVGEMLTGRPKDQPETFAMRWGHDHEPAAIDVYEQLIEHEVTPCGFIVSGEDDLVGCSPDGLVGDDGMVEVKCPLHVENHISVAVTREIPQAGSRQYLTQVLAQLWISGREWIDFVSYHPWIPDVDVALIRIRVYRDEADAQIGKLRDCVLTVAARVRETNDLLRTQ